MRNIILFTISSMAVNSITASGIALALGGNDGGGNAGNGGGSGNPRPETITCGLQLAGSNDLQATQSVLVEDAQALVKGEVGNIKYVFSVRGKTAAAKLTDSASGIVATAKGAIEMLRHGGETRPTPAGLIEPLRRGEDDANDGKPEREAGFDLSINTTGNALVATLKCESKNTNF
jgi:hypothetical protein